jgi:hypothetical protein
MAESLVVWDLSRYEKVQDKILEEHVELSVGPLIKVSTAKASALLYCTSPET